MDLPSLQAEIRLLGAAVAKDNPDVQKCSDAQKRLKCETAAFGMPSPGTTIGTEQLQAWRGVAELGTVLALKAGDFESFELQMAQLLSIYSDFGEVLPRSPLQDSMLGCALMHFLTCDRLGEFHILRQWLGSNEDSQNHPVIKFATEIEQNLTDGNYGQVTSAASKAPDPLLRSFMPRLTETVRERSAACLEKCYEGLTVDHACELLLLRNKEELSSFCRARNDRLSAAQQPNVEMADVDGGAGGRTPEPGELPSKTPIWEVDGGALRFVPMATEKKRSGAQEFLANVVGYAVELERIV
eukprot:Polyplicarium_translucidae@DN3371_c1_g1_i21.p2